MSADSIIPGQSDHVGTPNPQNLNRYAYGLNNPVKNNDPTGHCLDALLAVLCSVGLTLTAPAWAVPAAAAAVTAGVVIGASYAWDAAGRPLFSVDEMGNPVAVTGYATETGDAQAQRSPIDNNSDDEIPSNPVGKLTGRNRNYWKGKGVNPEKIKEQFVGKAGAGYDVYTDTQGNVWIKAKGETDDKAIYAGKLDEVLTDPDNRDDRAKERDRGKGNRGRLKDDDYED